MSLSKSQRRNKIKLGIRKKINGSDVRPRVSLYKSNKSIYSQIIDDIKGNTLVSCSSNEIKKKGINIPVSKEVGLLWLKRLYQLV